MHRSEPSLIALLAAAPDCHRSHRPTPLWPNDPELSGFTQLTDAAPAAEADPAVLSALACRADDELATLAALAAVATRLLPASRRWARCGLAGEGLADAEAQLVVEALAAMRQGPVSDCRAGSRPGPAPGVRPAAHRARSGGPDGAPPPRSRTAHGRPRPVAPTVGHARRGNCIRGPHRHHGGHVVGVGVRLVRRGGRPSSRLLP